MTERPVSPVFSTPNIHNGESPGFTIDEYLRKGDWKTIQVLMKTTPDYHISENTIIDTTKGFKDIPFNKMSPAGFYLFNRFRAWRTILEHINRDLTVNEVDAIIHVVNTMYKDINWNHTFWQYISCHPQLNSYAKNWIRNSTH